MLGYDGETIYKAELGCDSIYFVFTNRREALLSIMRADISDDSWTHYNLTGVTEIRHPVTSGTWVIRFGLLSSPVIVFKKESEEGCVFTPYIHATNMLVPCWSTVERELKGKHYNVVIEDDMVDAAIYSMSTQTAVRQRQGVITGMKEVKSEMVKHLYNVRIFNIKTEVTDYQAELVGRESREVEMLAAQAFGKFDPRVHIVNTDSILNFDDKDKPKD